MLYLEDYLEMIENLPMEMRDRFTEMREMDLEVQNTMDSLEGRVKSFFKSCLLNQDKRQEWKDEEFRKIRQEYGKALDDADEKVQLANQIYDMVDRYLRKLDQELAKFKMELEADNAGITEVLERRSLEMDKPSSSVANNKSERRKAHSLGANKHHTKHTTTPGVNSSTEKVLSSLATEAARDMGGGGISLHHRNSTSSLSSASTSNGTGGSGVGGGAGGSGLGTSNAALTGGTTYANNPSSSGSSASASSTTHHSPAMTYNLGTNSNAAIAAAASKAIGATLGMSQGRRTASLKASYEAVTRNADLSKELFPTTPDPSLAPSPAGSLDTPSLSNTPTTKSRGHKKQKIGHLSHSSSSSALLQQELQSSAPATPAPTDGMALGDDMLGEDPSGNNWGYDPNEPRYCTCNDVSYGDMVGCDNSDCPIEWFHYGCVGLEQAPKGKWYCPQCSISMKRRGRK